MSAEDYLQRLQFPVSQFKDVYSYEFEMPLHKTGPSMRAADVRNGKPDRTEQLRSDIRQNGIQQPISMFRQPGGQLHMDEGHHRANIAMEEGLTHVPAVIHDAGPGNDYPSWGML